MTNLLQQLSQLGLSPQQIEKTFFTVDEWLENEYPVMSQMYKNQLLQPILNNLAAWPRILKNDLHFTTIAWRRKNFHCAIVHICPVPDIF